MSAAQKALAAQPLYINSKYVELKLAQPKENISGAGKGLRNPELLKRTGSSSQSGGEFSGLATSYGRSGWKVMIDFFIAGSRKLCYIIMSQISCL